MNFSDLPNELQDHVHQYVANEDIKAASYISFLRNNPIYRIIMDGAVGYNFSVDQVQNVRNNLQDFLQVKGRSFTHRTRYASLFEFDMKCAKLYRISNPLFVRNLAAQQARDRYELLFNGEKVHKFEDRDFMKLIMIRWRAAIEDVYGGFDGAWSENWNVILQDDDPDEDTDFEKYADKLTYAVEQTLLNFKDHGIRIGGNVTDRRVLLSAAHANDISMEEIMLYPNKDNDFYVAEYLQ